MTASRLTTLVLPPLAEVDDDLSCALVQRVEVVAVLHVQTAVRELVDAAQAVHQFPEKEKRKKTFKRPVKFDIQSATLSTERLISFRNLDRRSNCLP